MKRITDAPLPTLTHTFCGCDETWRDLPLGLMPIKGGLPEVDVRATNGVLYYGKLRDQEFFGAISNLVFEKPSGSKITVASEGGKDPESTKLLYEIVKCRGMLISSPSATHSHKLEELILLLAAEHQSEVPKGTTAQRFEETLMCLPKARRSTSVRASKPKHTFSEAEIMAMIS